MRLLAEGEARREIQANVSERQIAAEKGRSGFGFEAATRTAGKKEGGFFVLLPARAQPPKGLEGAAGALLVHCWLWCAATGLL